MFTNFFLFLFQENYDPTFHDKVYNTPQVSVSEVMAGKKKTLSALRVQYSTKEEFKSAAKKLGIMDDFKV
jgi:alpha-1,3-mannosyl-glycoprotein beta-1,2-N-acetylglucosaminyltransferase